MSLLALYTAALLATSNLGHCSPALKTPAFVKAASQFHALRNRLPHAKRSAAMQGAGNPVVPVFPNGRTAMT